MHKVTCLSTACLEISKTSKFYTKLYATLTSNYKAKFLLDAFAFYAHVLTEIHYFSDDYIICMNAHGKAQPSIVVIWALYFCPYLVSLTDLD